MLQNELLLAKFRLDTADNELSKVDMSINLTILIDFDELVMNKVIVTIGARLLY